MIRARLQYNHNDVIKTFTLDQWLEFCRVWPGVSNEQHQMYRDRVPDNFWDSSTQRLTDEEGLAIEALGLELRIEGLAEGVMLTKMRDTSRWSTWPRSDPGVQDLLSGALVQVTIPDMALLQIQHVTWLEDACTEDLQRAIDYGWRILAVCPPNSQRRPDYILGWMRPGTDPIPV